MKTLLGICITMTCATTAVAEDSTTWVGTWNNRKYGTRGPLKCVAVQQKNGDWKAEFTGKFQGDPFKYSATFQSKDGRRGVKKLSGTATIRGHKYQWTGVMNATQLSGKYRSNVGYYGEFVLKQPQARRR